MLRIHFTAEDLARTRFLPEPAPMLELALALVMLHRRDAEPRLEPWRRACLATYPEAARPLREVFAYGSGSLTATAAVSADLDETLEVLCGLPRDQARGVISRWYGNRSAPVPSWVRNAAYGDRHAQQIMVRAFRAAYAAILRPHWSAVRANYHAELVRHGRVLARHGVADMLTTLLPGARWRDDCLEFDTPYHQDVQLHGDGLALAPSAVWAGPPLLAGGSPDEPTLLVYPSHTPTALWADPADDDPLAGSLGSTRAAVLRLLAQPTATTDIARQLGISPASASEHAATLRAARLAASHRDGKAVLHQATPLGLDLINVNSQQTAELLPATMTPLLRR
jgi:DNA-binding transcriptional ArsR family regulator